MSTPDTPQSKSVFVVARNQELRRELVAFLRMANLSPRSWHEEAHTLDALSSYEQVEAMLSRAQAILVLITQQDMTQLTGSEFQLKQQARPSGPTLSPARLLSLAAARVTHLRQVILLGAGQVSLPQAGVGSSLIQLGNAMRPRWQLVQRLEAAGCPVQLPSFEQLREVGDFRFPPCRRNKGET